MHSLLRLGGLEHIHVHFFFFFPLNSLNSHLLASLLAAHTDTHTLWEVSTEETAPLRAIATVLRITKEKEKWGKEEK